ncbi:MAG: hypothetical protein J6V95_07615 [Bacteroidaceae bacterium]|nr:hypothetical protein [Bacteroidaceae bacterium]
MRTYKFLTALMTVVISGAASAQTVQGSVDDGFVIKAGNVTMTVSAKEGGKIMSYKYDDKEMLSQLRMANQYGSTFWTSPQKEWNWPPVTEFDRGAYTDDTDASQSSKSLLLTSQVARKLPFQIQKQYTPDPKGKFIRVSYTIINKGDAERQVAPWEISRVVADESGLIFFEAPVEGITPAGLIPFKGEAGASWYSFEQAPQNRKINSDGKGWLAYAADGLLMIKKFADLTPSQPAPDEAEIQVYVNQGKTYIELESQGEYKKLAPGESLTWTVDWYLIPVKDELVPSKKLLNLVQKTIK